MSNKENITNLLDYFVSNIDSELQYDQEAIESTYEKQEDHQSLAIKILSVFGGTLASLAFLGFLFITGIYESETSLIILGISCIAAAIWINKQFDKIIVDTLSVSAYIIGFILFDFGLSAMDMSENTICIVSILIALVTLAIVQNYILSFIAIFIINAGIIMLIVLNHSYNGIHFYVAALAVLLTYVFLNEATIIRKSAALSKLYNPLRIGLIFSFLSGLAFFVQKEYFYVSQNIVWLSSLIIIAAIIYLLPRIFALMQVTNTQNKIIIYTMSLLLLLPTALSPAISGAILIMLLSFWVNYKTGLVIGIIAFIYFISQYYYDLHFTLLTKSILLFASGILFLGLYLFTHKKLATNEKV